MAQSDMQVADQDGASFLVDINAHLAALITNSSGATEPATTYPFQWWADTTAGKLKQRNAANSAWVVKGTLANDSFGAEGGTFTGDISVPDEAYGAGWNGSLEVPTKNAVYDKIETLGAATDKIQPITASVSSNALTITLNPTILDFRYATLSSGDVNTRTISSAISLTISSGSTLGTINGVQSRIAVLAIDNAGTVELAAVNLAGGTDLSETGLISTTAEGGAGGADSSTVVYSTTARTNVPYRVVGFVESTQATAGTWATAPSTIQGYGGQAFAAMSSFGYGQTTTNPVRALATNYYNGSKPKMFAVAGTQNTAGAYVTVTVNGTNYFSPSNGAGAINGISGIPLPPYCVYSFNISAGTFTSITATELG